MNYTISILPASTQAGREAIRSLLSDPSKPTVRGFYRDPSKAPPEFASRENFHALKGDVTTGKGLDFAGSDSVFYTPPPPQQGPDGGVAKFAIDAANKVKEALEKAGLVKRSLVLSAMGAEHEHGIGILKINHHSDKILQTAAPEVAIVRPGYFQENWAHAFETARAEPPVFYSVLTPLDYKIPMVSIVDVGRVCARKLLDLATPLPKPTFIFELYGPRHYSTSDVQAAVETVLGGKKVGAVGIEREGLRAFWAEQMPAGLVEEMVEYNLSALPGGVSAGGFAGDEHTVWGEVELVDTLRRICTA
ncbi:NmrA family protein [Colletotrichum sojae]|uniref:NmrA family protein n=1 Tax=Colletotrichum sojae TaxID=2175907 RepID=A0A8H6J4X3_9PEZI|nr:NmrA family protein [Colletotrichum sojae]